MMPDRFPSSRMKKVSRIQSGCVVLASRHMYVHEKGIPSTLSPRSTALATTGSTVAEKERKGVDNDFRDGQWSFNGGGAIAHCRSFVYPQRFGLSPSDVGAHSVDFLGVENARLYGGEWDIDGERG